MSSTDYIGADDLTWRQVSGDVHASRYGATFAECDMLGERLYGVRVLEITNILNASGEDTARDMGGELLVEYSYVDVDALPLKTIRAVLESVSKYRDELARAVSHEVMQYAPDEVHERMEHLRAQHADTHAWHKWHGTNGTSAEHDALHIIERKMTLLRRWFSTNPIDRAVWAAAYGGFTNGQSLTYTTLSEAMQSHAIPKSALWDEREYDRPAELEWVRN